MQIQMKRGDLSKLRSQLLCVPLFEGENVKKGPLGQLDRSCGGALSAVLKSGDFSGKFGSSHVVYNTKSSGPKRLMLLGVGDKSKLNLEHVRRVGNHAVKRAKRLGCKEVAILFPTQTDFEATHIAQALTEGSILGGYKFDKYKSSANGAELKTVQLVAVDMPNRQATKQAIDMGTILSEAVCLARDMVNAPANELSPTEMAARAVASGKSYGFKVKVLEKKECIKLGMTGLPTVSDGSDQPPKFIIMEHQGGTKQSPWFALVGKGLTFDAGGICLKPAAKMDEMKGDMGGGAAVIGAMEAVARLGLQANVVGLVPSTENLLGASAFRPGDILTYSNGKTVVIDNTDAEGRLILADALIYAQKYKPKVMIDLATLTGAALVALGQTASAVMGTDRDLIEDLKGAGERSFERVWELPLWDEYAALIRSPIADIRNSGGKYAGSITAAMFLKHFTDGLPWAHLDIAGTSYLDKADGYRPQGGTGVGVRLLVEYLQDQIERGKA